MFPGGLDRVDILVWPIDVLRKEQDNIDRVRRHHPNFDTIKDFQACCGLHGICTDNGQDTDRVRAGYLTRFFTA